MQAEVYTKAQVVETSDVLEAPWNVNVVPPEKYAQLKADMKDSGPQGTDPIHTCLLDGKRYTCDGAHRLRAAKELGWKEIFEYFHPEITTEEQARLFNYRRDAERGDVDPFKLAASFKWFVDRGLTQEKIAEKFGVDRSTVTHRLALINVTEEVKKQVVTDARMSVSHLEPIAALPAVLQPRALEEVRNENRFDRQRPITVREVQEAVLKVKKEDAEARAFQKILQDPRVKEEFRRCPKCHKEPRECVNGRWYLWPGAVLVVRDENYHTWCLVTGPQPEQKYERSRSSRGSSRPPQHEKSKVPTATYVLALRNLFDDVWPKLTDVDDLRWTGATEKDHARISLSGKDLRSVSLEGKLAGKNVELMIDVWAGGMQSAAGGGLIHFGNIDFRFERNSTGDKSFQTYVRTSGQLLTRRALHDLEDAAVEFAEEYGKLPRDQNLDWLRIERRKKLEQSKKVPRGTSKKRKARK